MAVLYQNNLNYSILAGAQLRSFGAELLDYSNPIKLIRYYKGLLGNHQCF
jgi:hypothetical protein